MQQSIKVFQVLFLVLISSISSFAQFDENLYYDLEPKDGGKINTSATCGNDIIFSGVTMMKSGFQSTITKIDKQGNVLWITELQDVGTVEKLITGRDGDVYAACGINSGWIIRLSALDGSVLWRTSIAAIKPVYNLFDFTQDKLLLNFASSYNGVTYANEIAVVEKANGKVTTLVTENVPGYYDRIGLAFDSDKNIYYTNENSVHKIGYESLSSMWTIEYPDSDIRFEHIEIDEQGAMFLVAERTEYRSGEIVSISRTDGQVLWSTEFAEGGEQFCALTQNATHLFVSWKSMFVGGGGSWPIAKIDKETGVIAWSSRNIHNDGVAKDMLLDDNDDLLITGSFDGGDITTGKWGIVKLEGVTGTPVYQTSVFGENPLVTHTASGGVAIYANDDKLIALGNIQTYWGTNESIDERYRTMPEFAILNLESGAIMSQSYYRGNYQYPSEIVAMERSDENHMIILKQIGRALFLTEYDNDKNVVWEKNMTEEYLIKDGKMRITPSGKIAVVAMSHAKSFGNPYFDTSAPDSIYCYVFEPNGTLSWSNHFGSMAKFYESIDVYELIDIYADEESVFTFFRKEGNNRGLVMRKVSAASITDELFFQMPRPTNGTLPYVFFDDTGLEIRIALVIDEEPNIVNINKNTLDISISIFPYPLRELSNVIKVADGEFVISGKDIDRRNLIMRYNLAQHEAAWIKVLANAGPFRSVKLLQHSSGNSIICMGIDNNFTSIRKIDFNSGRILGTYVNNTIGMSNIPVDVAINDISQEIIFAGYYTLNGSSSQNMFIGSIGLTDFQLKKINIGKDIFPSHHAPTSLDVSSDGNIWIGGRIDGDPLNKAAFLYFGELTTPSVDTQSPLLVSTIPASGSETTVIPSVPLILYFNENIQLGTGMLRIFNASTNIELTQIRASSTNTTISGNVITIIPQYPLPADITLNVKIDSGAFKDIAGNDFIGVQDKSWSFTTDSKFPNLFFRGATKITPFGVVSPYTSFELYFDESVVLNRGQIRIYNALTDTIVSAIDLSPANTSFENTSYEAQKITVTPSSPLPGTMPLYVQIDEGTFFDQAGNRFKGIVDKKWTFITSEIDSQSPVFQSGVPWFNEIVNPSSRLELSFNEDIRLNKGSIRIFNASSNMLVTTIAANEENTEIYGNTAYVYPSTPLPSSASLYVEFDAGIFRDLAGNPCATLDDKSWSFRTTKRTHLLERTTPVSNRINVSPYVTLELHFVQGTVIRMTNLGRFYIYDFATDSLLATIKPTLSNTFLLGDVLYITPSDPLPFGKHLYIKVDNDIFYDLFKLYFEGIHDKSWHFTTAQFNTQGSTCGNPLRESSIQWACSGSLISDLNTADSTVNWYAEPVGGSALSKTTPLFNGYHYYASQTLDGCESSRQDVLISVNPVVSPPTGNPNQSFCTGALVSDLASTGSSIKWYSNETDDTSLPSGDLIQDEHEYFATQTIFSCESADRLKVTSSVIEVFPPSGEEVQSVQQGKMLSDLAVTGKELLWYLTIEDVLNKHNIDPSNVTIDTDTSFYVTQTYDGCTSDALKVAVNVLIVTGVERKKLMGDLIISQENNQIKIITKNTNLRIKGVCDEIGRPMNFQKIEDGIILEKSPRLFIVYGDDGTQSLTIKFLFKE
jgi:hypothetical protein